MSNQPMQGIFQGFDIIGSGLRAEMQRAEVISINLSHLHDVGNKDQLPYLKRGVVFEEVLTDSITGRGSSLAGIDGSQNLPVGVRVREVFTDTTTPPREKFDPSHPMADESGYVLMTNVDMFQEMVELKAVQRSFQANLAALRTYRQMIQSAVQNIGR